MSPDSITCTVKLRPSVVKKLDDFVRADLFPSRSAVIVRAIDFFLARYSQKRYTPINHRNSELEREFRKRLGRGSVERCEDE